MKRPIAFAVAGAVFLFALPLANEAAGQPVGAAHHRYLFQATFTVDGIRNLQKQTASGFKAGVAKFFESTGGKLES